MSTVSSNSTIDLAIRTVTPDEEHDPVYAGLRLSTWLQIIAIGSLFALLFWPNLRRLWYKTNPISGEPNWGHAIAVPFIGLYYLYVNREQLLSAKVKTAWEGLAIALGGILFFGYGIWPGRNDWFKDVGMVVTLFGVVTLLCGWRVMKIAWFPIVFLICALPWPGLFYSLVAGPLQKLAAEVAVRVLHVTGVQAGQFGTKIFVVVKGGNVRTLNVAEACAGLRGLMTFVSIAAAVAFLSVRPMWQKIILVASAVPIAISCNTMRVTGQGFLARYASEQWGENFAHGFVGLLMMIPAFFLILLVGWVLEHIFIEEVEDKSGLKRPRPPGVKGTTVAAVTPVAAAPAVNVVRAAPASRSELGGNLAGTRPVGVPPKKPASKPPAAAKPASAAARPEGAPPVRPATLPPVGNAARRPPAVRPTAAQGTVPSQPVKRTIGLPPTVKPAAPRPNPKVEQTDAANAQGAGPQSDAPSAEPKEKRP